MATIHLTTHLPASPETCFDLVLNVDVQVQLDSTTRVLGGVTSGPLHLGDCVTWRAVHFGLPWRMTSKIIEVERPKYFVDAMQRGPFASWRHLHQFEPLLTGTLIHDSVAYVAPFGILGRLFDAVVLQRYLTGLLASRNQRLRQLAEGGTPGP